MSNYIQPTYKDYFLTLKNEPDGKVTLEIDVPEHDDTILCLNYEQVVKLRDQLNVMIATMMDLDRISGKDGEDT